MVRSPFCSKVVSPALRSPTAITNIPAMNKMTSHPIPRTTALGQTTLNGVVAMRADACRQRGHFPEREAEPVPQKKATNVSPSITPMIRCDFVCAGDALSPRASRVKRIGT